jgi:hypothetical protein
MDRARDMTQSASNQDPRTLTERIARSQAVFGAIAVVVGIVGFVQARDVAFSSSRGAQLGWGSYELTLMSYNRLGALVALVLGLIGLAAGLSRRTKVGGIAAAGFAGILLLGLVQVRSGSENLLGSSPQTMAFSLAMALGFGVTAALTDLAEGAESAI